MRGAQQVHSTATTTTPITEISFHGALNRNVLKSLKNVYHLVSFSRPPHVSFPDSLYLRPFRISNFRFTLVDDMTIVEILNKRLIITWKVISGNWNTGGRTLSEGARACKRSSRSTTNRGTGISLIRHSVAHTATLNNGVNRENYRLPRASGPPHLFPPEVIWYRSPPHSRRATVRLLPSPVYMRRVTPDGSTMRLMKLDIAPPITLSTPNPLDPWLKARPSSPLTGCFGGAVSEKGKLNPQSKIASSRFGRGGGFGGEGFGRQWPC